MGIRWLVLMVLLFFVGISGVGINTLLVHVHVSFSFSSSSASVSAGMVQRGKSSMCRETWPEGRS